MLDRKTRRQEAGATLVEVLVSVLILSLGMLSLSSMMAFTVQMPKLSGYRATAANLASSHAEKMRANPKGFRTGQYFTASSYDGSHFPVPDQRCEYPHCTVELLAQMDDTVTKRAARMVLPAGGVLTTCDSPCTEFSSGNVWVMWQEPDTRGVVDSASGDNCPPGVANPRPRCLYLRFRP